jgi:hypothetical protein
MVKDYQHINDNYKVIGKDLEAFLAVPVQGEKKEKPCAVFHEGMMLHLTGWVKDAADRQWYRVSYKATDGAEMSAWILKE